MTVVEGLCDGCNVTGDEGLVVVVVEGLCDGVTGTHVWPPV